jgi:microsomal dipeptidase-like Zn-dependent dipeptidase
LDETSKEKLKMAGDHFYTILTNERDTAVTQYGYQLEEVTGYVFGIQVPGSIPLYRLMNPVSGDHFYTTSKDEGHNAISAGYLDEGIACFLSDLSTEVLPLYRLYNPNNGDHFYTTSEVERNNAIANYNYQSEGVVGYLFATAQPNTVPLYRLYQALGFAPLPRRIQGFADLHNHQFANLAFGGKAFVGAAFGPIEEALAHCDYGAGNSLLTPNWVHGPGGIRDMLGTIRGITSGIGGIGHLVGGYPEFDGWPRWNSLTHQSVYQDWLHRAFQGGLKLLVVLAVNNEMACGLVEKAPDRGCTDMEAVDLQLTAAKQMEAYIDEQNGGPGQGWYRIVYSPQQARDVINAGKLAVVLGVEVDNLFGHRSHSPAEILTQVERYYALGVRHIFPIHFANNAFGGTAFQNDLIGDPTVSEPTLMGFVTHHTGWPYPIATTEGNSQGYDYRGGRVNTLGLTELGQLLIRAMMSKGMLIDIDHMSAMSFNDTLHIAESLDYPVVSSHTGFVDISNGNKRHEGNLKGEQVERIRRLGGMVACILNQGKLEEINTWRGSNQTVVEHWCGGTSETWAQAYLYAIEMMHGGPVAFGTDFNGMINPPGPRFGSEACPGGRPSSWGGVIGPINRVVYPFATIATNAQLERSLVGNKQFDINEDGLAHIGMLPDFIADLQQIGLTPQDLGPLLSSAEGYIQMWEKAERNKPPWPENVRCSELRSAIQNRRDEITRLQEAKSQARLPNGKPDLEEIAEINAEIKDISDVMQTLQEELNSLGCLS